MSNDRRLIEDYLPIQAISAEASREKSLRKGHISTLHLWWARRPLMACRAAVYGALVPASRFIPENGPDNKKQSLGRANAAKFIERLCKYPGSPEAIKEGQKHILEAHAERFSGETGRPATAEDIIKGRAPRPRVLDMFAGGGAIPLEAQRLGCEAYALDLNPVAHIIELCTLVYPQKYGKPDPNTRGMTGRKNAGGKTTWGGLSDEVRYWGERVLDNVRDEIGDLYPLIADPSMKGKRFPLQASWFEEHAAGDVPPGYLIPVAYLWTRTVTCKNPRCRAKVPLVRQTWLCKKPGRYVAMKMVPLRGKREVRFEVIEARTESAVGFDATAFSKRGNAICPFCGTVADLDYVKAEGRSGRLGDQIIAAVAAGPGGRGWKYFALGDLPKRTIPDERDIRNRLRSLYRATGITAPTENIAGRTTTENSLGITVKPYGIGTFQDLFTPRQLLFHLSVVAAIQAAQKAMQESGIDHGRIEALTAFLGCSLDRGIDFGCRLCVWNPYKDSGTTHAFGRQIITMVWDYSEVNPFNVGNASWRLGLDRIVASLRDALIPIVGNVCRGSATELPYSDGFFDVVVTDPPYYDNVPYSDIADFFYVWLKRSIGNLFSEHFATENCPKKSEAIADAFRHNGNWDVATAAYEQMMASSFVEANRVLRSNGELVIVYAHKTTLGWATLVDALRRSNFTVAEAWPLDTEFSGRLRNQASAALASSIFLVARKRDGALTGSYEEEVRPELERVVRERVDSLWKMGITGADLVIAAVGAGLRAFTRFARVEYANGEDVPAEKFLGEVEGVVLETLLEKIFGMAGSGVSAVDGPSRFYVLWRYAYKVAEMDAGEAIVFTYGQNVELDGQKGLSTGRHALVVKKKGKYILRDFTERGEDDNLAMPADDGTPAPLIDALHRILWLVENHPSKLNQFLDDARPDRERLRVLAQALAGTALAGKQGDGTEHGITTTEAEQAALKKLVANWRTLIDQRLAASEGTLFDTRRK